jgi:hypothetical protein
MNSIPKQCFLATGALFAFSASPAFAQDSISPLATALTPSSGSATFVDLTGSLGFSSNPFVRTADSKSSFLGRASVRGVHSWAGERSTTGITGFVEGTTYFNDYGVRSIFAVSGNTTYAASETVSVYGSAGVSGDLSGQLGSRFVYVPPFGQVPDPTVPPPPTVVDPDVFDFSGRTYRIYGQGGASIQTGTRSSVGISGGISRAIFTGAGRNDYTSFFGNGSYNLRLSDRTVVGAFVRVTRTEHDGSNDRSTIINPAATLRTRLAENLSASLDVGVSFSSVDRDAIKSHSTNLSVRGSLCRTSETENLCGRVSRYAQTSASSDVVTTDTLGVDWSKQLDDSQSIQLMASVVRYAREDALTGDEKTNYYRFAASYSRRISSRLSGGVDLSARSLRRDGTDPDTDITGTVFVRYRLWESR